MVRYADDFVVFCESREDAESGTGSCRTGWPKRGLSLSEEKTRIVHLTEGFDFLGFNVRHYPAPKPADGIQAADQTEQEIGEEGQGTLRQEWLALKGSTSKRFCGAQSHHPGLGELLPHGAPRDIRAMDDWMFNRRVRYVKPPTPTKGGMETVAGTGAG